jgi:hypothetical protein
MNIGHARVSTTEQNLDLQRDALKRAGCEKIIEDTASGGNLHRSGLERVQDILRCGDVLAVWRLDRLGRSLKHLIELMGELEAERIGFQSVSESIDTTTPPKDLIDAPPSVSTAAWVRVRPSAWGFGPMNGCQVGADQGSPLGLRPIENNGLEFAG